jgi:hypothetical protein
MVCHEPFVAAKLVPELNPPPSAAEYKYRKLSPTLAHSPLGI